jgi:hypothetical protein
MAVDTEIDPIFTAIGKRDDFVRSVFFFIQIIIGKKMPDEFENFSC